MKKNANKICSVIYFVFLKLILSCALFTLTEAVQQEVRFQCRPKVSFQCHPKFSFYLLNSKLKPTAQNEIRPLFKPQVLGHAL